MPVNERPLFRRGLLALCLGLLAASGARGEAAPAAEGSWDGVIVYTPAVAEVEISIELFRDYAGALKGLIDIPTKPIDDEPLSALAADGRKVSWELRRETGTFVYQGELSADGREIRGRYFERGKTYDFTLARRDATPGPAPAPAEVHTLSASGEELKARFNQDQGSVRLILLLSPG